MPETQLETARRHVREGSARIVRQERILLDLTRIATPELVASARETLVLMRRVQRTLEEHRDQLEG